MIKKNKKIIFKLCLKRLSIVNNYDFAYQTSVHKRKNEEQKKKFLKN